MSLIHDLTPIAIRTPRLDLIAATGEIIRAELEDQWLMHARLNAAVPVTWPPVAVPADVLQYFRRRLSEGPDQAGWWNWYIVLDEDQGLDRVLIGSAGFQGPPRDEGVVEVGYSVLPEYQCQGYATEALSALTAWAFEKGACRVTAVTYPDMAASIRVLDKCGFARMGDGPQIGSSLFEREAGKREVGPRE